jgi:hypothetical protein
MRSRRMSSSGSAKKSFQRCRKNSPRALAFSGGGDAIARDYDSGRQRESCFGAPPRGEGWKIKVLDGAAELLGVKPTPLMSRIGRMGLKRPC